MLGIMLQKLWQKKWMNLSLLLGCILLIATSVSFPLYQKAAYDRMLQDELEQYMAEEGRYPMVIRTGATCQKDKKNTIGKMEDFSENLYGELDIPEYLTVFYYTILRSAVSSDIKRQDAEDINLSLSAMTDLEDHATLINGSFYSEDGYDEEGRIEVVISQATMVQMGLLLDETLTFQKLKTADGKPVRIHIVGVFTGDRTRDFYFQENPDKMFDICLMKPDLFRSLFTGENASRYTIAISFYDLFDYTRLTASKIDHVNEVTDHLCNESAFKSVIKDPEYRSILEGYAVKQKRISATLLILQIPVLILLGAFLLMISGQMYEMERNEISVIKSRGSSRGQILLLYLYQGLFLTITGALCGIPLGGAFARVLGATRNFLEFNTGTYLNVTYSREAFLYALGAMLITLLCISLPVVKHSKVSIVNLKQQKTLKKKSFWERFYLDLVLLGISLYGFFTFRGSLGSISETVLSGKSLNPLLYLSSSLFIVGTGLLFLRIQPYLVKLIYLCVQRLLGPSGYISFMENIRNGRKMQMIMLFLIMTVSLGIFHATVARTILENAVENTDYLSGADVILKENWPMMQDSNGTPTGNYIEPDYSKYLKTDFMESTTKVCYDDKAYLKQGKTARTSVTLMGIHTREFGEMTSLPHDVNEKPYYEYLNELAKVEDGVLLSRNFATSLNYKIGDSIGYYTGDGKSATGTVVDFVDFFPTYSPSVTVINPDGNAQTQENFLIVAHYSYLKKKTGTQPYEVWIRLKDHDLSSNDRIYDFIRKYSVKVRKYSNHAQNVEKTVTDPLLQGTNGVLTMGFAVTILLCAVGYLIYWIMSIRERELVFGVLRACGFHKNEIVRMLIHEQIFSGVFSVLAGIGIGILSSKMFVPMLQASYATSDQVLPMHLITDRTDLYRLYGIVGLVMLFCMMILIVLLFRMNVTKALKLGEE